MYIIKTARRAQLRRTGLIAMLGALSAFGPLTTDMYLPAMPVMAVDLHTGTVEIQLTLITFVAVFALSQLVYGSVSDAVGRRIPLLVGLAIFVIGSTCCAVATSVEWLVAARVLQAAGAAASTVLSRAIVRDMFSGLAMTRFFSSLMLVTGAAPVLAPLLGAQLIRVSSWRSVFVVLAIVGIALFAVVAGCLEESLSAERRRPPGLAVQVRIYRMLLRDLVYLRYVVATSLMFAAMFAYIAGSSFVLQEQFDLSAQQFSLIFGLNGFGLLLLGQINGRVVGRLGDESQLMGLSLAVGSAGGLGVLAGAVFNLGLATLLVSLFITVASVGPVLANGTSLALSNHGANAGAAASLQGVVQFAIAGSASTAMGLFGPGFNAMAIAISTCAVASLLVFLLPLAATSRARWSQRVAGGIAEECTSC